MGCSAVMGGRVVVLLLLPCLGSVAVAAVQQNGAGVCSVCMRGLLFAPCVLTHAWRLCVGTGVSLRSVCVDTGVAVRNCKESV
jgi:hypothetical protein